MLHAEGVKQQGNLVLTIVTPDTPSALRLETRAGKFSAYSDNPDGGVS
ncbi:hypothetical protein P4S63_01010 [Pseudoalteromonas sp. B193]